MTIQIGDSVHARIYSDGRSNVAMQNFVVQDIQGTVYLGGALPCDIAAGWELELTGKALENLQLPDVPSEITAYKYDDQPVHIMGKGDTWMTMDGEKFETAWIFRWEPGHI